MGAKVYIAPVGNVAVLPVWPAARQAQLDATVNEAHRQARYAVWRLLEYALWDALGLRLQDLQLSLKDGKWSCPECFFSLSHSEKAVAVAVSAQPVGVDIECMRPLREELAQKILNEEERKRFRALSPAERVVYLLTSWCEKESMFKCGEDPVFRPGELSRGDMTVSRTVHMPDQDYIFAVTCPAPETARVQVLTDLWQKQ